jgi:exodeoxyribonuclease-3
MKIISYNVNGLRSAFNNGFKDFINVQKADILFIEEVKLPIAFKSKLLDIKGYKYHINYSNKNGYSGVMFYYKKEPINIIDKLGYERFDNEGRFLLFEYESYIIIGVYMPHGGRYKENLDYKLEAYEKLFSLLDRYKDKNVILLGDFNVAHTFDDVEKAKSNINNIMFTEEERQKIDKIINYNFIDAFRVFNKEKGNYTWFPYAFNAKERNLGWRIDYIFISKDILNKLKKSYILKEASYSDHCPIVACIDI